MNKLRLAQQPSENQRKKKAEKQLFRNEKDLHFK